MIKSIGEAKDYGTNVGEFYYVVLDTAQRLDIIDWCLDHFGIDRFDNWYATLDGRVFYFTTEHQRTLFLLRWS